MKDQAFKLEITKIMNHKLLALTAASISQC